jgi:DNA/RNA endonuclease G (NUC1)
MITVKNKQNIKRYLPRADNFRPDYRLPIEFKTDLVDYQGSGFDRGHLIASANQRKSQIQNNETYLLSNMSPQVPGLNRGAWRRLETAIRSLNEKNRHSRTLCDLRADLLLRPVSGKHRWQW